MAHHDALYVLIGVAAVGAVGAIVIANRNSSSGSATAAPDTAAAVPVADVLPAWDATSSPPPMNQPSNYYLWYNAQVPQPQGFIPGAGPACNCPAGSGGDGSGEGNG